MSIFRRMFNRKENDITGSGNGRNSSGQLNNNRSNSTTTAKNSQQNYNGSSLQTGTTTMLRHSPKRIQQQQQQQRRINNTMNSPKRNINNDDKRNLSVLQLTPLWEHIIRTRTLPDTLNPIDMFNEFLERLRDPEWQVRQHALRVLVDVLFVIGQKADTYFHPLIGQLVENLGHPAPTVRKGALDCLRVYLSETAMPESILLEILDIGLNQRITNEPFGGRLTCGVMLSLPSLVQATLQTPKRNFILQSTIDLLVSKMTQITHQEITLKVLLKLKELLGVREFMEYMSASAYREFELLCNVYGIGDYQNQKSDIKSWKLVPSFDSDEAFTFTNADTYWRPTDDYDDFDKALDLTINNRVGHQQQQQLEQHCPHQTESEGKIIMETEIKINDDTLTMRILEAKDDCSHPSDENLSSSEDEKNNNQVVYVHHNSFSPHHHHHHPQSDNNNNHELNNVGENSGFVQVLTDSEVEEINQTVNNNLDYTIPRTPKRVTFGGEIVKMRTPDSDTIVQSDADSEQSTKSKTTKTNETNDRRNSVIDTTALDKLNFLTVDIPNDNTKPISAQKQSSNLRPKSAQPPKKQQSLKISPISSDPSSTISPISPLRRKLSLDEIRQKSGSPKSPFKRISVSPVDDIVSPKPIHKEIEVLHNLQREISPNRQKHRPQSKTEQHPELDETKVESVQQKMLINENYTIRAKTWEELGIVKPEVLKDLKSGDWRYRSHAICSIEEALKSSDNLALVQPNLDTLLRTLLSSEKNNDVAEDKRRVIMNLISRLPLDNLENRTVQIINGLCRQGGPGSNRVSKTLMQRLPPAVIVLKLLSDEFLHARSSRFRENALQMVMYALMTFPSTCFDTSTCVTRATYAALDRKKRVRQAALDVLAILGQVTSPRTVMEIVQDICDNSAAENINSDNLLSAVKARLSRKQLPNISPDGFIQYALRLPSPQTMDLNFMAELGADIEWIVSGIGSVSPTSVKRRKYQQQQQQQQQHNTTTSCPHNNNTSDPNRKKYENDNRRLKPPHEILAYGVGVKQFDENDENKIVQYHMPNAGMPLQINQMKFHQDNSNSSSGGEQQIGINGKRIPTYTKNNKSLNKSCSDSSIDGRRNYDSRKFNNMKEERSQNRNSVTSRFPAMERLNVTGTSIDRQSYRNPYEVVLSNGNRLNVAYQRPSYSVYRKGARNINYQEVFGDGNYENSSDGGDSKNGCGSQIPKRFMNVDKFIMQSNKPHQQNIYTTDHQNNYDDRQYHVSPHNNDENNRNNEKSIRTSCCESRFIPPSNPQSIITKIDSSNQIASFKTSEPLNRNNIINREESSELSSSEERFTSSGHSTPTQQIGGPPSLSSKSTTPINKIQSRPTSGFEPTAMATAVTTLSRAPSTQSNLIDNENVSKMSRPESPLSIKSFNIQEEVELRNEEGNDQIDNVDNVDIHDSLEIVEDIEDVSNAENILSENNYDYSKSDEIEQESIETVIVTTPKEEDLKNIAESKEQELKSENLIKDMEVIKVSTKPITVTPSASPIPTVEVKPISRQSSTLAKSYDSIYETSSPIRQDLDIQSTASTGSSSDYPPSVAASLDCPLSKSTTNFHTADKPPHIPLMRKSKTTLFGSRHRRVSPVKQTMIKLNKTELYPQTLGKFDKPKDGLNLAVQQLEDSNWEIVMTGLVSMVRLMRFHPEYLDAHIHIVCMQLAKTVKNLRSQVARAACQASTEFFSVRNKFLEQECDDLVGNLLNRTADTNRFIRADATRALESMCDNLTPPKILHLLTTRGALHQNAVVRTATAKLMNRLVDRLGCERVFSMNRENREKVFLTCANLLLEGSLETRNYAKSLFGTLCEHPNYNRSILEFVPSRTYRNIEKTLKSIR